MGAMEQKGERRCPRWMGLGRGYGSEDRELMRVIRSWRSLMEGLDMAERGQEAENRSKRRRRAETRTWMMEGCGLSLAAQGQDWDWGQPFMLGGLCGLAGRASLASRVGRTGLVAEGERRVLVAVAEGLGMADRAGVCGGRGEVIRQGLRA